MRTRFRQRQRRARWTRASGQPRPRRRWVLPVMLTDIVTDGGAAVGDAAWRLGLARGDTDLVCFLLAVALGGSYALTALGDGAVAGALVWVCGALGGLVLAQRDRRRLWLRWRLRRAGMGPFVVARSSLWGVSGWAIYDRRKPALFTTGPDAAPLHLQARRLNDALRVATDECDTVTSQAAAPRGPRV